MEPLKTYFLNNSVVLIKFRKLLATFKYFFFQFLAGTEVKIIVVNTRIPILVFTCYRKCLPYAVLWSSHLIEDIIP